MFSSKCLLALPSNGVTPNDLILETVNSENLVHLHLYVMAGVPVAVDVDTAGFLKEAFHLVKARVKPDEVAWHPAFPNVGEGAQFVLIAEDDIILPAGEKGRIEVYKVNAFVG